MVAPVSIHFPDRAKFHTREWTHDLTCQISSQSVHIFPHAYNCEKTTEKSRYWAYSRIHHIARSSYQNEVITANNTVNKEECIVVYSCVRG